MLTPDIEQMLLDCDPGIRPYMRLMTAGGFETYESCQGGEGHAYAEPSIRFYGKRGEGFRASPRNPRSRGQRRTKR